MKEAKKNKKKKKQRQKKKKKKKKQKKNNKTKQKNWGCRTGKKNLSKLIDIKRASHEIYIICSSISNF